MNTMLKSIEPKSDQLNADDLIGGQSKTIKITKVDLTGGEQPCVISFEGDNGKPYKPGKSMRRVLVNTWGPDTNVYIGRSLTLYRDEKVVFGGMAVGGLRISHMSHIDKDVTMALTSTRASRKPFTVKPLIISANAEEIKALELKTKLFKIAEQGKVALSEAWGKMNANFQKMAEVYKPELDKIAAQADEKPPITEQPTVLF